MDMDVRDPRHPSYQRLQLIPPLLLAWITTSFLQSQQAAQEGESNDTDCISSTTSDRAQHSKEALVSKAERDFSSVTELERDRLYKIMIEEVCGFMDPTEFNLLNTMPVEDYPNGIFALALYRRELENNPQKALQYGLASPHRDNILTRRPLRQRLRYLEGQAQRQIDASSSTTETVATRSGEYDRAVDSSLEVHPRDRTLTVDLLRKYHRQTGELSITKLRLEEIRLGPHRRSSSSPDTWDISDFHHRDRKLATDLIRKHNRQSYEAQLTKARLEELRISVPEDADGRVFEREGATQRLTLGNEGLARW